MLAVLWSGLNWCLEGARMKSFALCRMLGCCLLFSFATVAIYAQDGHRTDPEEAAARAEKETRSALEELKKLQMQIEVARGKGQPDVVAALEKKFKTLETEIATRRLELHLQERRRAAERQAAEQRAVEQRDGHREPERRNPDEFERRLNHLREAAEILEKGGFPDMAHQLHRQAETLMAQRAQQAERERHSANPELGELHQIIRRQNERIEKLEHAVRELAELVTDLRKRSEK